MHNSLQGSVQEYSIRVPKNLKKHHHVMRFNATLNVDFAEWKFVKLERENNLREFKDMNEDAPKFGAGSEYNSELREEIRRKKYGVAAKRYKPEAQPWVLKVGGKSGKKFRGVREGGVGENAAFYVFTHATDGAIEAYPLNEWYNFQPIQRYKALSAEEAEHEFGRRKKVLNYFSLMLRKRLKGDEDVCEDPDEAKLKGGSSKSSKELKISDMDEWMDSDIDSDSENSEGEPKPKPNENDSDVEKKNKNKKNKNKFEKKKKKKDLDDEAFEESDDGDEEGRELDYISDSSDSEPDPEAKANKEMKSVAEETALRRLLTSDEDSDDEKRSGAESDKNNEDNKNAKDTEDEQNKSKKKLKHKNKDEKKDSSTESSSDSSDSEVNVKKKKTKDSGNTNSMQNQPEATSNKRKKSPLVSDPGGPVENTKNLPVAKKIKLDAPSLPLTFASVASSSSNKEDYGITEEAVRRYLMRKPMTTTELLTKFKNKKTGVSSERLVETMTQILKRINPVKQTIQGKMYLSIKVK